MKKGDLKRNQILDCAEKLFFQRGYDHTSVQDILNALNISKGGFYHYFDAKESVLRELCERRWTERFEKLRMELYGSRRGPMDKLNLLLNQADLFEQEDVHFSALMVKVCYRDGDVAIRDYRRRTLMDLILPALNDVVLEGIAQGVLYTRQPTQIGKLLMMLACDVNDEVCDLFAQTPDDPDRMVRMLELLNAYRESVELLAGVPYGSMTLIDAGRLVSAWQAATEELSRLEGSEP